MKDGRHDQQIPVISMRPVRYADGTYGVELFVTGLVSEQQATAAMAHMQRLFCAGDVREEGQIKHN